MERKLEIGGVVVFIDSHRMEHKALVTAIHGHPEGLVFKAERDDKGEYVYDDGKPKGEFVVSDNGLCWPCINLVCVSPNEACQDQYGRQLERDASVVHQSSSSAIGNCYRFMDEDLAIELRQPTVS